MPRRGTDMVAIKRAQLNRHSQGVDVTVMSSKGKANQFAPTWELVTGHKSGIIDDDSYAMAYGSLLKLVSQDTWDWLAEDCSVDGTVTLLCYCKDDKYCHTHLIALYAASSRPTLFTCDTNPPQSVLNTQWFASLS